MMAGAMGRRRRPLRPRLHAAACRCPTPSPPASASANPRASATCCPRASAVRPVSPSGGRCAPGTELTPPDCRWGGWLGAAGPEVRGSVWTTRPRADPAGRDETPPPGGNRSVVAAELDEALHRRLLMGEALGELVGV